MRAETALLLAHLEQLCCPHPDPTGQQLEVVPALHYRRILAGS